MENPTPHACRNRYIAVTLLGLSSGLPLALSGSTLQAWFTEEHLGIALIGFLNIVGLPYLFKWLWAPFLDKITLFASWRRKSWIMSMQALLSAILWIMSYLHPAEHASILMWLAFALAFFSATQDIAIDAYRTEILLTRERGLGAALTVTGGRMAILIAGALALILADHIGWDNTYRIMALIMSACLVFTFFASEPKVLKQPSNLQEAFIGPLVDFLKRPNAIWLIVVIVLYKLGEAYAASLTTPFLIRGLNFTLTEVALLNKVIGLTAMIIGGIAGGLWMTRLGLFRSMFIFGVLAAFTNVLFVIMAIVGKNMPLAALTIFSENFCSGMSATAFVAFLMALCNPKFTAMQYACLSAFASVGRVLLGSTSGFVVSSFGWTNFYWLSTAICIPGLYLLWRSQDLLCFRNENALAENI